MKSAYTCLKVPSSVLQTVGGRAGETLQEKGRGDTIHAATGRSTCFCAILPKLTLIFDEGLGLFEHPARKSTYLQYPVKPKSPSATKSTKTFENCLVEWSG